MYCFSFVVVVVPLSGFADKEFYHCWCTSLLLSISLPFWSLVQCCLEDLTRSPYVTSFPQQTLSHHGGARRSCRSALLTCGRGPSLPLSVRCRDSALCTLD
ncbi:unnamed protein product [Lota lota]